MQSRILITRPERECSVWVSAMLAQGLRAVAVPLIDTVPVPFAWDGAACFDAYVFVSRSAVVGFFQSQPLTTLQAARCLVTGPGTREALIQLGLASSLIDAPHSDANQFDSEALWQVIGAREWFGKRVCVVRGSNHLGQSEGRSWLADKLVASGASVHFVVTYQRRLPALSDAARAILDNIKPSDIWVFSSSQAVQHLQLLLPSKDWSAVRAVVTHERIFVASKSVGFADVRICRPSLTDVMSALKAFI